MQIYEQLQDTWQANDTADLNTDDIEYFATKSEAQTEIDDICAAPALDYISADFRVAIAAPPF